MKNNEEAEGGTATLHPTSPDAAKMIAGEPLIAIRDIHAPRERVFHAWTHPDEMARWWGAEGFTNPMCRIDHRAGGAFYIIMHAPDGREFPLVGVFEDYHAPSHLTMAWRIDTPEDDARVILDALTAVTFEDMHSHTRVTVEVKVAKTGPEAPEILTALHNCWKESLDRLEMLLS